MKSKNTYEVLERLTKVIGPSGFEKEVQDAFSEIMSPFADKIHQDNLGNCYAEVKGSSKLPKIMFNAHADTIGFIVKFIDDEGFVFTDDIAECISADYRMLPGTSVVIIGRRKQKNIPGKFIPVVPIHKMEDEELRESIAREDLAIDIGARSLKQAKHYIDEGDYVVWEASPVYYSLGTNKQFESANLDDRLGLFCMYRIAKNLKNSKMKEKCPVTFVSTVSEEGMTGAAKVAAENVKPDIALTLECTSATDQIRDNNQDTIAKRYSIIALDKGVAIARGLGVNDDLFLFLEEICRGNGRAKIPYQVEIGCGEVESKLVQITGKGVKTALISVPTRYCHTPTETLSLKDVESAIDLCTEFYQKASKEKFS